MNANDLLSEHTSTENWHKYMGGLLITDGVKALAEKYQCYWFLDIIASYQHKLTGEEFQSWKLERKDKNNWAVATCEDGNGNFLLGQQIPFTDFEPNTATVWVENGVALLPSER